MSMIYQEKFDIGPETMQMDVGMQDFHAYPALNLLENYNVLLMGFSEAQGLFNIERDRAPFHVLLIGVEGQGEIIDGDQVLALGPNQLGILPAYGQRGLRRASECWRFAWFLLDDAPRWAAFKAPRASVRSVQYAHSLFYAMHTLCYEARIEDKSQSASSLVLVMDLLQRMLSNAVMDDDLPNRLRHMFERIRFDPAHGWRVDSLARQYGVSATHFQRLCLKHLGQSPQQLIIQERMLRARELLANGNFTVSEVAHLMGYEEAASFSRRFRAHFGIPPSELVK
ncbi:AraC family transcriptional regulator [Chitinibacter sp. GC72]|uniref:helix-turn-helix transcriptional regulator n=1 Tax=Chitinibacter sp. GC72 TaxID=1526917 RepID=UPI0012F7B63F|nr:AraC family transcriptional regulator [Chitinibacter sp. GC72]